jgi:hypothetical protein
MTGDDLNMDQWLHTNVSWMVKETSQYFDTRELLMLCQTVAVMRLNQTLKKLVEGRNPKPAAAKAPKPAK